MRSVSGGHTGGASLSCFFKTWSRGEGVGYKTIADNIKVGCLPKTINLSRLDDGVGIVVTFRQHQTKWHDSYRLQFNETKLERAEKRKSRIEDNTAASKKFTRRSIEETPPSTKICFFCGMPPVRETLRNAKKSGSDWEPCSTAALDGDWPWNGTSDWRIWGFNHEEKENRFPASRADETCTDDIRTRYHVINWCNRRDGKSIRWEQQGFACTW